MTFGLLGGPLAGNCCRNHTWGSLSDKKGSLSDKVHGALFPIKKGPFPIKYPQNTDIQKYLI